MDGSDRPRVQESAFARLQGAATGDRTTAGTVEVSWSCDGDRFRMSWTGRDGTTVIESMARQALGGEVELDYDSAGVSS